MYYFGIKTHREFFESFKMLADVDIRKIEENGQDGLCSASIHDDLIGEEQVRNIRNWLFDAVQLLAPFEQKYESVDRTAMLRETLTDTA